jgi:hypothetical protein
MKSASEIILISLFSSTTIDQTHGGQLTLQHIKLLFDYVITGALTQLEYVFIFCFDSQCGLTLWGQIRPLTGIIH